MLLLAGLVAFGVYRLECDRRAILGLEKARSAIGQGDFDQAIVSFDGVLQLHLSPARAAEAYYGRGCAKSESFKYEDAIRDFSEAIRLDPTRAYPYWGRGYAYQEKKELDHALVDYSEALQRNPNLARVYLNRGRIYRQRKEWSKAALDFSEAIRCEPGDALAYFDRGSALLELGDLDGALASLDASISIYPRADAYKVRALIHKRRGDGERSRSDELKVAELVPPKVAPGQLGPVFEPSSAGADLLRSARIAVAAARYDEAIDLCNRALGMTLKAPLASEVFTTCGNGYAGKNDWDHALRDYDEAIKIEPRNTDALINRGNAYAHKNQLDKSIQDYSEAIRLNPNLAEAYCNRAFDYIAAKKTDLALADLAEAIRVNPKFTGAYRWRALLLLQLKRTGEALTDAESLVNLTPGTSDAYYCRGRVHLTRREYTKARTDLERALQLGQEPQRELLNSAAWFYATCPDKAVRDGKRAVELATKACEVTKWASAHTIDTLAAAFAEAGNFSEAIKWQSHALDLSMDPVEIRSGMRQRLQSYQKLRAYHEQLKP